LFPFNLIQANKGNLHLKIFFPRLKSKVIIYNTFNEKYLVYILIKNTCVTLEAHYNETTLIDYYIANRIRQKLQGIKREENLTNALILLQRDRKTKQVVFILLFTPIKRS